MIGCANKAFWKKKRKRPVLKRILPALLLALTAVGAAQAVELPADIEFSETRFDFGSAPEDFKLHHRYFMINRGFKPIRVDRAVSTCDCTRLYPSDSVADPGDTIFYDIWFDTKNYYGSTTKSIMISLHQPEQIDIEIPHHALISQWPLGLRPKPLSVMLLPNRESKKIAIRNHTKGQIEARLHDLADTTFTVELVKPKAGRDRDLEFEVHRSPELTKGTHRSNFTVAVTVGGVKEPLLITIPVKLVQF